MKPRAAGLLFVDLPFVSPLLAATIESYKLPLVMTPAARALGLPAGSHTLTESQARALAVEAPELRVLTSSENALAWIAQNLSAGPLPELASIFKDKARFRERTRSLAPELFFREVTLDELRQLDPQSLPLPVIVKPNVGFFSLAVERIEACADWQGALQRIEKSLAECRRLYPTSVLDLKTFLIEQCIEGDEFAVDAYLDADSQPTVLGIWSHAFSGAADTSDRVYSTSNDIVAANLGAFTEWLREMALVTGARNMPLHVELRRTKDGLLRAIEVNPLRFGGWCTTADLTAMALGFNPYAMYFDQGAPDWKAVFQDKTDITYSIVVLDNSTGLAADEIASFDYDALLASFARPLELRRIDFHKQPMFGILFVETARGEEAELDRILRSDLTEFIRRA